MDARFAAAHCGETAEVIAVQRPWPSKLAAGDYDVLPQVDSPRAQQSSQSSPRYSLLCLFQGQGSAEAAQLCSSVAVAIVEDVLPPYPASLLIGGGGGMVAGLRRLSNRSSVAAAIAQWEGELQAALLCAVVQLQAQLGQAGCPEGCGAAVVVQVDRLVTCAVLGDVEVALCTSTGPGPVQPGDWLELSVDHRLASNAGERGRLLQAGARLAPRDIEENSPAPTPSRGIGNLRMWPGGLESGRALGFFDVRAPGGDVVLPLPHIRQARLPSAGGRIVLATRNVWEAGGAPAGQQQAQQEGCQGVGAPDASKSIQRALLRGRLSYCTRQVLEAVKVVEASAGEGREQCSGGDAGPAAAAVVAEVRPADGDGRLSGKVASQGCSFLGLFGRRSSKAAAAALAAPLSSPDPARLLCDLDTAVLMGLTAEEPPERPPVWLTLRLMGDIHSCLKRAYQSWKVVQRAALAAGFPDGPVQPTLRSSARHSSSGSLHQQQVTSWQSDDGAGSEHEASGGKSGKKQKKQQSLGWLADVYDKRASHHMRGTTAQPSRKHGSSQSLQDGAEEGPGRGSRAGSRDTSPGRGSYASSENELSLPAPPRKVRRSVSSIAGQGSQQGLSVASVSYSPMPLGRSHSVSDAKLPPVYPRQRVSGDSVVAPQTPTVPPVTPRRPLQHASSAAARLEAAAAAATGSAGGANSSSPAHGRAGIRRQGSIGGEMQASSLDVSRQASMDEGDSTWPEARTLPRLMRTGSLPVVKVDISPKALQPAKPRKLTRGSTMDSSANSLDSVGSRVKGGSESEGEVAAEEVAAASGALALFYKNSESRKEKGKVQTRI